MTKKIYLEPIGGLANRMRAIASAISLRQELNVKTICVWKKRDELNCDFEELFDPIENLPIKRKSIRFKFVISTVDQVGIKKIKARMINWIKKIDLCIDEHNVRNYKLRTIGILNGGKTVYIRTGQIFADNVTQYYRLFKPNKELLEKIDEICNQFTNNTIGIHIRRTDNTWSIENSPTELFIKLMKEELNKNPTTNFFVCTDELSEKETLTKIFGEKIISRNISVNRNTVEGVKDALIDLYSLSNTNKIYGSYGSSFSLLAANLGEIEIEIIKSDTL